MAKDVTDALDALMRKEANEGYGLPDPKTRGALPSSKSSKLFTKPGSGAGSELTELDYSTRTYYPNGWKTSDGLFTFPAIKKVTFTDASGSEQVLVFAEPVST